MKCHHLNEFSGESHFSYMLLCASPQINLIHACHFTYIHFSVYFFVSFNAFRKRNGQVVDTKRDTKLGRMEGGDAENIALIVKDVTRHDMGNYTCELENEYGTGISDDSIIVNVHCKYIPIIPLY